MEEFEKKLRFRKWHITVFKDAHSKEELKDIITAAKSVKYLIIGQELAPTTQEMHWHCYVEFEHACTFTSLKKILPTANIQDAHGTAAQNKSYITKEDKEFLEIGTPMAVNFGVQDIANNVLSYMYANPDISLLNLALDIPEFSDYIIKNYNILKKINEDIIHLKGNITITRQEYELLKQEQNGNFGIDLPNLIEDSNIQNLPF